MEKFFDGMMEAAREQERDRHWTALMARAQDGDQRAYGELLAEILPFLRQLVRRQGHAPELAEDAVQDVLLTLHRVRHTFDPARSFTHWIAAIAQRRSIDLLRKRGRQVRHEIFDELSYETFADPAANRETEALDAAAGLGAAMQMLSESQREAIRLVKLQEMSLAEAAQHTGKSEGTLKVTIHRALARLRETMGKR